VFQQGDVALLKWDNPRLHLTVVKRSPGEPDSSFIHMDDTTPIWQLEEGWYQGENKYRWIQPHARARLYRPAGAREFTVEVNIGPGFIAAVKKSRLTVLIDGKKAGEGEFTAQGWKTLRCPLPDSLPPATVHVELVVEPAFHPPDGDPRVLGLPIGAFGFTK
jgi:hypothetical protein